MKLETLEKGHYYHIYNRGINSEVIFKDQENMRYFLSLVSKYLSNKVTFLAYSLLNNHYHFLVKIDEEPKDVTKAFSDLFNSYAKAFNKRFNRTGSLFEKHFKRKKVTDEKYLKNLILYIHKNPENHKLVDDFQNYKFSSYQEIISKKNNLVAFDETILIFNDLENFVYSHTIESSILLGNNPQGFQNNLQGFQNDLQGFQNDLQGFQNLVGLNKNDNTYKVQKALQEVDEEQVSTYTYKVLETLQDNKQSFKEDFYAYIQELQDSITSKIEEIDGKAAFQEDLWKRKEGGGGRTRVIENGAVFEKGGVNISKVFGELPEALCKQFKVKGGNFFACGLSLVLHPINPFVPTVHANWRYFEMYNERGEIETQWFGGGQDLTPYYLLEEDAVHFHTICKLACDKHNSSFYSKFKETCDTYFWNSHRNEARGIGGLFFDYLKETDTFSMKDRYNFVREIGDSFLESYIPIVEKRKDTPFTEKHKNWQEIRRGRYVEFNLVHDRGTLFGLKTNGRIESILMSLPPRVQWKYNYSPEENSEENKLLKVLANPKEWVSVS